MPNGNDTVTVQMPDGRILTGPKSGLPTARLMGAKIYDPSKQTEPTGAVAALKELGSGVYQFGKAMLDPRVPVIGESHYEKGKGVVSIDPKSMAGALVSGLPEEHQKAKELWKQGHPIEAAGHEIASLVPGVGPIASSSIKKFEKGDIGGGLVMAGAAALGAKGLARGIGDDVTGRAADPAAIADHATTQSKGVLASIFNEGATHEKMQKLLDYDSLNTKAKLSRLDKSVEADASGLMDRTSKSVDAKFPQGSTNLSETSEIIKKGLGDRVKAKTIRAKLPPSMTKVLDEASGGTRQKGTAIRLSQNELQTLNVLQKEGAKGEDLRGSLVNMGYAPKQIDAMMQVSEGTEEKTQLSGFEKMKQLRTELGKELFTKASENYPGTIRHVMYDAWKNMTDQLDAAANKAGVGEDWERGKKKYADYIRDFYGSWERGKYNQSPIDKSLKGQNAMEIMEPLAGKSAQQARDILRKYSNYGVDPKEIAQDVRRHSTNLKVMRFASPSKWDIIIGGMALYRPEYGIPMFIARYGLPRAAEKILSRRAEGIPYARPSIPTLPEVPSE